MSNLVSWAIVTLDEVKEALDISGGDHDAKLNGYINRATGMIEAYCQRRFAQTTYTNEEYDGTDGPYLFLRNYPVTTLSSVAYRSNDDLSNPSFTSLETTLFSMETQGGRDRGAILYTPGFRTGHRAYRVSYIAGYAAADMPYDLREACVQLVAHMFNARKSNPLLKSETLGQYSYTKDSVAKMGLIKALGLNEVLDMYRTIPI